MKTITTAVGTDIEAAQSFEYDEMGRQTAFVDAEGNRTEYRYDAMGRQTHVIEADPDGVEGPLESPVSRSVYDLATVEPPLLMQRMIRGVRALLMMRWAT